jgi:virginiamycin B lyase
MCVWGFSLSSWAVLFAQAPAITEYNIPTPGSNPRHIASGPDGALWFTEGDGNKIGRISATGTITEYAVPTSASFPESIASGADGALWFTESNVNKVGRITTSGSISEFPTSAVPEGITAGPDGALWFTEYSVHKIGRITTSGAITEYVAPPGNPSGITAGPDGALWFADFQGKIGRITTGGTITEYPVLTPTGTPTNITAGPDGALWFTEPFAFKIGRITTSGVVTEYSVLTAGSAPQAITKGSDGALWFTESTGGKAGSINSLGRITTTGTLAEYQHRTMAGDQGIALGPDGALWFVEQTANKIARAAAANLTAAPASASIVNAASNIGQNQPNGGIAEGAIFVAYGTGLGPAAIAVANAPFRTTSVGGTSVKITVNGVSIDAPMYYASATQVAGMVPSSTPTGTGTYAVTFDGQTSAPAPIIVVKNNFGTFSVNQAGGGDAIVTYADYSLVTASKAANPGETVILWGTGLGPVSGNETVQPLPGDMPGVPVQVWLGNLSANVIYRGRSGCCIAEDQIVFTIPSGVEGCAVPLAVQIGDQVSNFTSMAIAASGRSCTAEPSLLPPDFLQQNSGKSFVTMGSFSLSRFRTISANLPDSNYDSGGGFFFRVNPALSLSFLAGLSSPIPYNTCNTFNPLAPATADPNRKYLDDGPSLSVTGPNGVRTIQKNATTFGPQYSSQIGDATPGNYLDPGHYTLIGPGGSDIVSFSASLDVSSPRLQVTNNASSLLTLDRSQGLIVTWTGGPSMSLVVVEGIFTYSGPGPALVTGGFACYAQASAGLLTVPPFVLKAMPVAPAGAVPLTSLTVTNYVPTAFTVPGVDAAFIFDTTQVYSIPVVH